MSEGIDLPRIARAALPPEDARLARFDAAAPQILAAVDGERDAVVVQATLASLLWETFPQASWVGFYRRVGARKLSVGPYQGPMGCLHIAFDRGVCGACARTGEVQLVPDVAAFADHIACDDATRSELVLPVFGPVVGPGLGQRAVQAVLDFDSHLPAAFGASEAARVASLLTSAFDERIVWPEWE
jgi:L-methionine (R)-S-oxide reductase